MAQVQYAGTGGRKNSVARVRLVPGTGKITMNGKDVRDYLPYENLITDLSQPFGITETTGSYDVLVNVNGGGFSGQAGATRHGIARALLKKPKILILDDSTSAVDTATDAKIRHSFAEKIPGTTVFIIAQRISSVEHADRILVLDGSTVSGFDTHEALLATNPLYQEIYAAQTSGGDFDALDAD